MLLQREDRMWRFSFKPKVEIAALPLVAPNDITLLEVTAR